MLPACPASRRSRRGAPAPVPRTVRPPPSDTFDSGRCARAPGGRRGHSGRRRTGSRLSEQRHGPRSCDGSFSCACGFRLRQSQHPVQRAVVDAEFIEVADDIAQVVERRTVRARSLRDQRRCLLGPEVARVLRMPSASNEHQRRHAPATREAQPSASSAHRRRWPSPAATDRLSPRRGAACRCGRQTRGRIRRDRGRAPSLACRRCHD